MKTTRKSKGDVNFYLEKEGDIYHFSKTLKIQITNQPTKTKRIKVSDFNFTKDNFNYIDFNENGLRLTDKQHINQMMLEIEADNG